MPDFVDGFLRQWAHINEMTLAFVDNVPEEHWLSTPHARFAPFGKQVRHVVGVRGVYNDGIASRRIDFGRKHEHYTGGLERDALRDALLAKSESMIALLKDLSPQEREEWSMDFFGQPVTLAHYTYKVIQHEAIHHGEWSLYAAVAGFSTPRLWLMNWGL